MSDLLMKTIVDGRPLAVLGNRVYARVDLVWEMDIETGRAVAYATPEDWPLTQAGQLGAKDQEIQALKELVDQKSWEVEDLKRQLATLVEAVTAPAPDDQGDEPEDHQRFFHTLTTEAETLTEELEALAVEIEALPPADEPVAYDGQALREAYDTSLACPVPGCDHNGFKTRKGQSAHVRIVHPRAWDAIRMSGPPHGQV